MQNDNLHEVVAVRHLTESAYIIRMKRRGLAFRAGQHILLGQAGSIHNREYSIYSGEVDDFFEVLVKEVDDGLVSKQLKNVKTGDKLQLEGPLGFLPSILNSLKRQIFCLLPQEQASHPFIAL